MAETLLTWTGETDANPDEYWERDGGMSTVDNDIWVFGDTPRVLASDHNTAVSLTWGSTWTILGVEQGTGTGAGRNFNGIGRMSDFDLRWPTGITMYQGEPLVTFVRVNPSTGYSVVGWGYSHNGTVFTSDEIGGLASWGSPRIENGEVWIQRQQTLGEGGKILTRRLTDDPGDERPFSMPPWGLEMNTQWGEQQSLAARNIGTTYQIFRTFDRNTWELVASITGIESGSRNPWPHATNYGCLLTWWDGSLSHMVRRLIAFSVPIPMDTTIANQAAKAVVSSPASKAALIAPL